MRRRTVTVRAAPAIDASARRQHRLCPRDHVPLPARALPAAPLSPLPAFDSLQQSTARSTGATTTIKTEVASGLLVPILSILDDPTLLELSVGLLPVAARRHGAARRRLWRLRRRTSAAARTRRLRRAARECLAALVAPKRSLMAVMMRDARS